MRSRRWVGPRQRGLSTLWSWKLHPGALRPGGTRYGDSIARTAASVAHRGASLLLSGRFQGDHHGGLCPKIHRCRTIDLCIASDDLSAKRAEVDAVIAVHMFGNVCNVPELRDAVGGKPIIEDCALSLGSRLNGRPTGTLGEIGVFSFRSGKYLSVGEGGALYANDPELRRSLRRSISALPASKAGAELVHIVKTYLRSALRSKPLYGLLGHALWEKYNQRAEYSDKSPISLTQPFKTDLTLAAKRLPNLDLIIQRQRDIAQRYSNSLRLPPGMLCLEESGAFYNRYQYPILSRPRNSATRWPNICSKHRSIFQTS